MFSNIKEDVRRKLRSLGKEPSFLEVIRLFLRYPPMWAVLNNRIKYWSKKHLFPIPVFGHLLYKPYRYIFDNMIDMLTGTEIGNAKIGKGFIIFHGQGLVINGNAEIGENCTVNHQVTIGDGRPGYPKLGNKVVVYTGAKVLGSIKIGDNSIIGANSVVLHDVPPNCVVAGIPAKVLHKRRKRQKHFR